MMPYSWEPPFVFIVSLFMAVMSGLGLYQWRKWRKEQRQDAEAEASFDALMCEIRSQHQADEAAHRLLALADTLPPMPVLPALIPAWQLDASDSSDDALAYCPICALEGVTISGLRDADGYYPLPRGKRVLCSDHTVRWEQRLDGDIL